MSDVVIEESKEKKKKKSNLKKSTTNDGDIVKQGVAESNNMSVSDGNEVNDSNDSKVQVHNQLLKVSLETNNPAKTSNKSPIEIIYDILSPPLKEFNTPYVVPDAVKTGDVEALQELDERKIIELKEAFTLFDLNGDGLIDANDLKATFTTLGQEDITDAIIEQMLNEAMKPLNFDAFVILLGYKTIELDPEDVLIEALSKWDLEKKGVIVEEKIRHDLMSYGDRFTETEAYYALEEAPIANKNRDRGDPILIDYQQFCKVLGGLRKRKTLVKSS